MQLGVFARQILPADLRNVVAPGRSKSIGGQSVVELEAEAFELFRDVGADGVADGDETRETPPPTPTPEPTPEPTETPEATPKPTPLPTPPLPSGVPVP